MTTTDNEVLYRKSMEWARKEKELLEKELGLKAKVSIISFVSPQHFELKWCNSYLELELSPQYITMPEGMLEQMVDHITSVDNDTPIDENDLSPTDYLPKPIQDWMWNEMYKAPQFKWTRASSSWELSRDPEVMLKHMEPPVKEALNMLREKGLLSILPEDTILTVRTNPLLRTLCIPSRCYSYGSNIRGLACHLYRDYIVPYAVTCHLRGRHDSALCTDMATYGCDMIMG